METWGLSRGTKVRIIRGACTGLTGTVQSNMHQPTVDDPENLVSAYRIVLDNGEMAVVRREWVEIQGNVPSPAPADISPKAAVAAWPGRNPQPRRRR